MINLSEPLRDSQNILDEIRECHAREDEECRLLREKHAREFAKQANSDRSWTLIFFLCCVAGFALGIFVMLIANR